MAIGLSGNSLAAPFDIEPDFQLEKPVNERDPLKVLGVDPNTPENEISAKAKKFFRLLSVRHHPDFLVGQDTYFVGNIKGIGKIYQ